jgi:hypothetical protein
MLETHNRSQMMHNTFSATNRPWVESHAPQKHAGMLAATAWLEARGLRTRTGADWDVAIALDVSELPASPCIKNPADSRFHIAISAAEWGFFFCHRGRASWIRVKDVPFVNECDDHRLVQEVPPLRDLGRLIQTVERRNGILFRRLRASVRTNLVDAEPQIRGWIAAVL